MRQPNPQSPGSDCSCDRLRDLEKRIKQLGDKASQLLLFLSFALVVAAILETQGNLSPSQTMLITFGMRCWTGAIFPILISVLPVKEIREHSEKWYEIVRWSKFVLLWIAISCIFVGAIFFLCAIWRLRMYQG
jgi:hypothetical protein